jgi:hypothetical protein
MPDRIRTTLMKALKQLQIQRGRLETQISAVSDALAQLGGLKGRPGRKTRARRRTKMSAAQKRAVSKRMKAYWAKRRAGKTAA